MPHKPRPLHVASESWASISRELQVMVFANPKLKQPTSTERLIARAVEHIEVKATRIVVSGKWVFNESKGGKNASR